MPHNPLNPPNYVSNAKWDCIEKVHSRIITIIDLYKHIFDKQFIPHSEEYWSMCGAHFNPQRKLKGELGHLCESKLIKPEQYFGVDREQFVIEGNQKILPNINWILGDFYEVIEKAVLDKQFNPAIINYDGVMQPKFSVQYLKKIFKIIDYNVSKELLLVANFILTNPYLHTTNKKFNFTIQDTINILLEQYWIPDHWDVFPRAYQYRSPSRGANATMGIIMFIKKEHDPKNIQWTTNRQIGMTKSQ